MKTKICKDCKIEKEICFFRKYRNQCKECEKKEKKRYYQDNKEKRSKYYKDYRDKNKELYAKYRKEHKNKQKEYMKEYYKKHKEEIIKKSVIYEKSRIEKDNIYKLKKQIRKMIYNSFYRKNYKKKNDNEKILGCDIKEFINYLLETFKNNYGYEWDGVEKIHIDHIIPLASAKTEKEVIKLCNYKNLQLLKEKDNLCKHDKLDYIF